MTTSLRSVMQLGVSLPTTTAQHRRSPWQRAHRPRGSPPASSDALERRSVGRSVRHLVTVLDEMAVVGVAFVSLGESLDRTTPAGKLQLHMIAGGSNGRGMRRSRIGRITRTFVVLLRTFWCLPASLAWERSPLPTERSTSSASR